MAWRVRKGVARRHRSKEGPEDSVLGSRDKSFKKEYEKAAFGRM